MRSHQVFVLLKGTYVQIFKYKGEWGVAFLWFIFWDSGQNTVSSFRSDGRPSNVYKICTVLS